jgi:hypothetical protein
MENLTLINGTFVNNSKPMMIAWSTHETANIVGIEMIRSKRGIIYPAFIVKRFGYLEAIHLFDTLKSSARDELIPAYNSCNGNLEEFYQFLKNKGYKYIECIGLKMNEHVGIEFPEFVLAKS